jgi:hypothetical protein
MRDTRPVDASQHQVGGRATNIDTQSVSALRLEYG